MPSLFSTKPYLTLGFAGVLKGRQRTLGERRIVSASDRGFLRIDNRSVFQMSVCVLLNNNPRKGLDTKG